MQEEVVVGCLETRVRRIFAAERRAHIAQLFPAMFHTYCGQNIHTLHGEQRAIGAQITADDTTARSTQIRLRETVYYRLRIGIFLIGNDCSIENLKGVPKRVIGCCIGARNRCLQLAFPDIGISAVTALNLVDKNRAFPFPCL